MTNARDEAAERYALDPKNCMTGFVPMGHTGVAFKAGWDAGAKDAGRRVELALFESFRRASGNGGCGDCQSNVEWCDAELEELKRNRDAAMESVKENAPKREGEG